MKHEISFKRNERCFIRKDHDCGRYFGVSKMCFIACPNPKEVGLELAIISEKLQKEGIDPFIAVRERAYGEDILCTKICGRIIESMFCIVLLNDVKSNESDELIPNPNVYYEYGLMTALKKEIIPLQHSNHDLAFNIQGLETIRYTNESLVDELENAIKKTLAIIELTRETEQLEIESDLYARKIFWTLESKGLTRQSRYTRDSLLETSDNTVFMKYTNPTNTPIFIVIVKNDEMTMDIIGGMKAISSRIEKIKYRTETEIRNIEAEGFIPVMSPTGTYVPYSFSRKYGKETMIDYTDQLKQLSDQLKQIGKLSFLVLATEGFSEIDKVKAAHESIKIESKPKLEIVDPEKVKQSIIDEGLEI